MATSIGKVSSRPPRKGHRAAHGDGRPRSRSEPRLGLRDERGEPLASGLPTFSYDAFACLRGVASRRRGFRSRLRRAGAIEGVGDGGPSGAGCTTAWTESIASAGTGRVSMTSRTARPFSVMRQPPFSLSTRPCENISKPGTRAANLLVRSVQSRPLVVRIAISRLRSAIAVNPSG